MGRNMKWEIIPALLACAFFLAPAPVVEAGTPKTKVAKSALAAAC